MPIDVAFAVPTIKLLLAGYGLLQAISPGGKGIAEAVKSFADLFDNSQKLDKLLGDRALLPLVRELQTAAQKIAADFLTAQSGHQQQAEDAINLFDQVAGRVVPGPDELARLGIDPAATLAEMLRRAMEDRDFARSPLAPSFFTMVLGPVLQRLLNDAEFVGKIEPSLWRRSLEVQSGIKDDTSAIRTDTQVIMATVLQMQQMLESKGEAANARASGVTDLSLIGLARRSATSTENLEQAFREFERLVEIEIGVQTRTSFGSNSDSQIDDVIRQVQQLSARNENQSAIDTADQAIQDWKERQKRELSGVLRLLAEKRDQYLLLLDAKSAAAVIAETIALDSPDPATHFTQLRAVQDEYYARGRDRGLNLDLAVSIHLARQSLSRATDADQRGTALNDLGISLGELGQRETSPARLEQAVQSFRAALEE